ncbi:MAG: TetR/AcrR family transcriptional regulator [Cytophagales bacterium]|nr:TetR/AcrR family transcriptional regulator [Armatimonadota bacterium]
MTHIQQHGDGGGIGSLVPPRRREQRRQNRETAILQAAQALMEAQGYDAMTMDDLAARAGISKPTLYQHFPSKEEIAVRAVVQVIRGGREFIESLDSALPAIVRLEKILRRMLEAKFTPGHLPIGPATRTALAPMLRAHPLYQAEFEAMAAAVSEVVEQAKRAGDFRPALPTRPAVQMMFSVLRDSDFEEMVRAGAITPSALAESVVTILLTGMCHKTQSKKMVDDRKNDV